MKKIFEVTMSVEVEMEDSILKELLPEFNEMIFETNADGLLSHIATMTAHGYDNIEYVGENGRQYKARLISVDTEVA